VKLRLAKRHFTAIAERSSIASQTTAPKRHLRVDAEAAEILRRIFPSVVQQRSIASLGASFYAAGFHTGDFTSDGKFTVSVPPTHFR
jgi:hypothetical protein